MKPASSARRLTIWVVSDGKPGHLNQALGLADALARAGGGITVHTVPAFTRWQSLTALLFRRMPDTNLPEPDLVIGAGHRTHLTLLAARGSGRRTVVLMKPSLPRRLFDLCLVPEHDGIAADVRTLVTQGALNRIRPMQRSAETRNRGLLLIGGVSPHFAWDSDAVQLQIKSVLARTPDIHWTLTTSRRTPDDFLAQLPASPNLTIVPHTATSPDWLPTQLAISDTVWVTPDSVSMVYEALTAGADVGVFDLPVNPKSRVGGALSKLADAQRVTRFVNWCAHGQLQHNIQPLAEADRCAAWILDWLETQR